MFCRYAFRSGLEFGLSQAELLVRSLLAAPPTPEVTLPFPDPMLPFPFTRDDKKLIPVQIIDADDQCN